MLRLLKQGDNSTIKHIFHKVDNKTGKILEQKVYFVYSEFRTLLAILATLQLLYNHSFFKFKIYETGHREYSSAKKILDQY